MQTTERPAARPGPRGTSPVRGIVLVAVAVVLGFFVLRAIDDTGGGSSVVAEDGETGGTEEPAGEGSSDTTAPTETTLPEARPPAEVVVIVANASGVQGAAAGRTDQLAAAGFQTLPATNAPESVPGSQVLPVAGYEADAAAVAELLGVAPEAVQAMPDPPPVPLDGAHVLVLLGPDLASGG